MRLKYSEYNADTNTLVVQHNSGLLSIASVTMYNLIEIYQNIHPNNPVNIIWTSNVWSKTSASSDDTFDIYFKQANILPIIDDEPQNIFLANNILSKTRYNILTEIKNSHFILSDSVQNIEQEYINKYNIDFDKTLALLYRGTDKIIEIPKVHPSFYVSSIKTIIKKNPDYKILVQTDQTQALDYYKNEFQDQMFYLEEMPTVNGNTVMHQTDGIGLPNYELGKRYLAAISLISKCKHITLDTGNAPTWIGIFRESAKNTYQIYPRISFFKNYA